jgi:hypothetical protein
MEGIRWREMCIHSRWKRLTLHSNFRALNVRLVPRGRDQARFKVSRLRMGWARLNLGQKTGLASGKSDSVLHLFAKWR